MQQLALEQRRLLGPRAGWHIGDIAWGLRQHEGRESEWKIRLWVEDGRVVAWSWLKQDGRDRLEHDVHPEYLHLPDEILAEPAARAAVAYEDDVERRAAPARPRRRRRRVRARAPERGTRPAGVRLLRDRTGMRALPVARLPHPRLCRRILTLTAAAAWFEGRHRRVPLGAMTLGGWGAGQIVG